MFRRVMIVTISNTLFNKNGVFVIRQVFFRAVYMKSARK